MVGIQVSYWGWPIFRCYVSFREGKFSFTVTLLNIQHPTYSDVEVEMGSAFFVPCHLPEPFGMVPVETKMGTSKNRGGPPKSSILIGFFHYKPSILGFPPIFGNTQMALNISNSQNEFSLVFCQCFLIFAAKFQKGGATGLPCINLNSPKKTVCFPL